MKNLTRSVDDVIRNVVQISKNVDRVLDELDGLKKAVKVHQPQPPAQATAPPVDPGHPLSEQNFYLGPRSGHGAMASFGGEKSVHLPPRLVELVIMLKSSEGQSSDDLVEWKSFDFLSGEFQKKLQRPYSHENVSNLLTRLRKAFKKAGLNPRLVQSDGVRGARLRLKRPSTGIGSV